MSGELMAVTGASGRIGRVLRRATWNRPVRWIDRVKSSGVESPGVESAGVDWVGDLADRSFAERALSGVDTLVHLAAITDPAAGQRAFQAGNVALTDALLEIAAAAGVQRVVLASSVHAVGAHNDPDEWPIGIDIPTRPCCDYGASKVEAERLVHAWVEQTGRQAVIVRLSLTTIAPRWSQEARAWLSDADLVGLLAAAARSEHRLLSCYGTSDCPQPRYDPAPARRLGYRPSSVPDLRGLPTQRFTYPTTCTLWRREQP